MLGSGRRERRLPTVGGTIVEEIKTKMVRLKNERSGAATDNKFSCLPQLIFHRRSEFRLCIFSVHFILFKPNPTSVWKQGFLYNFGTGPASQKNRVQQGRSALHASGH